MWVKEGEFIPFDEPPLKELSKENPSKVKRFLVEQEGGSGKKKSGGGGGKRRRGYADVILDCLLALKPPVSRLNVKNFCADAMHVDLDNEGQARRFDVAMEQAMALGCEKKWWEEVKGAYKLASDWKKRQKQGRGDGNNREEVRKRLEDARGRLRMGYLKRPIDGITKGYPVPDEQLTKSNPKPVGNRKHEQLGSMLGDILFIHGVAMGQLGIKEIGLTPIFSLDHLLAALLLIGRGGATAIPPLVSALLTQLLIIVVDSNLGKDDVGQSVYNQDYDVTRDEAEERYAGSRDMLKVISPTTWPAVLAIYLENQSLYFEHRKKIEKQSLSLMDESKKLMEVRKGRPRREREPKSTNANLLARRFAG